MKIAQTKERPPRTAALIAFSTVSAPIAAITIALGIYLPRHFASHVGISLAEVGAAFAIVRLLDITVDLLLGIAMDRTNTPIGRFRVWLLGSVPILMIAVYMVFIQPAFSTMTGLVGWLLVLYFGMSALMISHTAWAAKLATGYNERSRIFGMIGATAVAGSICVFITPVLLGQFGLADDQVVPAIGWLIFGAVPVTVALAALVVREKVLPRSLAPALAFGDYGKIFRNASMRRIVIADFCLAMGPGWLSATIIFLLVDARGFSLMQTNILLALSISAGFLGAPLMSRLAMRVSKHRALMVAAIAYGFSMVALATMPPGNLFIGGAVMFGMGFVNAAFTALLRAMTADVSDEIRLEHGYDQAALLYSIMVLTTKAAGAMSIFVTFTVLDRIGFDAAAGSRNSSDALFGLEMASVVGPTLFVLLGALALTGYGLTSARHGAIQRQLSARDEQGEERVG